jgi:hypothetical protein
MECELFAAYRTVLMEAGSAVECVVLPGVRMARMARRNDWRNNMLSDAKHGVSWIMESRTGSLAASKVYRMGRRPYTKRSGSGGYFVREGYI